MKIKTIEAHYHLKHSLPNYGSFQLGAGMTADIEEGEDFKKSFHLLFLHCMSQVLKQFNTRLKNQETTEQLDLLTKEILKEEGGET